MKRNWEKKGEAGVREHRLYMKKKISNWRGGTLPFWQGNAAFGLW